MESKSYKTFDIIVFVFFLIFDLERSCTPVALVLCGYVPALYFLPRFDYMTPLISLMVL